MKYFGGKARISKDLSALLNKELEDGQAFVDMFCGSCNIVSKIEGERVRVANDIHPYLIDMWKHVQSGGELPDSVTEDEYKEVKANLDDCRWLSGFVGFGCSFAGKWFGGYARGAGRDWVGESKRGALRKAAKLSGVTFNSESYDRVSAPNCSLIYCDIPYKGTTGYSSGSFDHEAFYSWALDMVSQGHRVLVSEYYGSMPSGCQEIWRKASKQGMHSKGGTKRETIEVVLEVLKP